MQVLKNIAESLILGMGIFSVGAIFYYQALYNQNGGSVDKAWDNANRLTMLTFILETYIFPIITFLIGVPLNIGYWLVHVIGFSSYIFFHYDARVASERGTSPKSGFLIVLIKSLYPIAVFFIR